MNEQVPRFCPTCQSTGLTSRVQLYQINFEEAAVMCENAECPFPFVSSSPCPLTVPRDVSSLFATPLPPSSLTDGDSLASSSSASTWKSNISTSSNISSTASTPPPGIVSQRRAKPNPTAVNPRSVMSRVAQSLAAAPRNFSAQSSPASSTVSMTDREVELFMRNSYAAPNINPTTQLTPSPSPEVTSDSTSQLFDDLEQLLSDTLTQGDVAITEETEALVKDFLDEFQASEIQDERLENRANSTILSSPEKKPVARPQSLKRKAPSRNRPESASQVTVQLTNSGVTEFVIQPPVSRPVSKPASPKKRARPAKKPAARNDLNWVAESVSSKPKAPIKVSSVVRRFLMNLPNRPASV